MTYMQKNKTNDKLAIVMGQEHNLDADELDTARKKALIRDFQLIVTSGRADDPTSSRGGVFILIDTKQMSEAKILHEDPGFIRVTVDWGAEKLDLANVYAPVHDSARIDFYNTLRGRLSSNTIVGGDWNTVTDVTLDVRSRNPLGYPNRGASLLATVMGELGLTDERREQLGDEREYTRTADDGSISTRLDRWYVPVDKDWRWTFDVTEGFSLTPTGSDHSPVWLRIDNKAGELGSDRVTIDARLFDESYVVQEIIRIMSAEYADSRKAEATKWRRAHARIRDYLIGETKHRKKREKDQIDSLNAQLKILELRHKSRGSTADSVRVKKEIQKELYELQTKEPPDVPKAHQAQRMFDKSEVSSRSMFAPYKSKMKQQWIDTMKKNDWQENTPPNFQETTTNVTEVGEEFVKLYKTIFARKHIDQDKADRLLRRMGRKQILKQSRLDCDKPFNLREVSTTMEALPRGKQAGPNRIPNEMYKILPHVFAQPFVDLINETQRKGELPKSFLEGDISMLYKKGDREDPRNYRPITLLNTDYKIFTRILSKRMIGTVHEFVSETLSKAFSMSRNRKMPCRSSGSSLIYASMRRSSMDASEMRTSGTNPF